MILFFIVVFALGVPASLLIDRDRSWIARVGESWYLGAGLVWASMMLFWSPFPLLVIALLLFRRRGTTHRLRLSVFDLTTLITIGGYALFATAAAPWEFDYLTDFGWKARTFFERGGIDWTFLRTHVDALPSFNPSYPVLLSSLYDAVALLSGEWNDRFLGLVHVAFGVAAICVVRAELAEESRFAALGTAIIAPLLLSPWIGMGDGPVGSLMFAAVLRLRRETSYAGAIFLGLAACVKQEGIAFVVAVAIAMLVTRPSSGLRPPSPRERGEGTPETPLPAARGEGGRRPGEGRLLLIAALIAVPWMIAARLHGVTGRTFHAHIADPRPLLGAIAHVSIGKPLMWSGILLGAILCWRALDRFLLVAVAAQFVFYVCAYLASSYDAEWHVAHSWERILSQITPILVFVIVSSLAKTLARLYYSSSTSEQWPLHP